MVKVFYIVFGIISVGLGLVGVVIPGLPTVPFLLLASFFFIRSSKKMHDWLINHRVFGPILADFNLRRGIRLRIKILAIALMWITMSVSVCFLIEKDIVKYVSLGGAIVGTIAILSFRTIRG